MKSSNAPPPQQDLFTIAWNLLNISGWPWAHNYLAFTSEVLELSKYMNTDGSESIFLMYDIFSSHWVYWGNAPLLVNENVYFIRLRLPLVLINCRGFFPSHVFGFIIIAILRKLTQSYTCLFVVWNRLCRVDVSLHSLELTTEIIWF